MKCGIAAYASQMVSQLRKEGHVVDIFSPEEGNGDFTTDKKKNQCINNNQVLYIL